ncbi:hypothetical protein AWB74_01712 [Caballeronia arvi]|uniref:Uncharacterized protein n=1 Tax=Caballeronia arvi TaxID=1777135 RepID=A0A158HDW7_9BURK|nr:hypothetical protein [Caballeronia arvi]SAL42203.1 hypothetical protein AWB74_01712 [Caballeronia arvi]
MGWQYNRFQSSTATHQETGLQIEVAIGPDGLRTFAVAGAVAQRMSSEEIDALRRDLQQTLLNEDRRGELRALINQYLGQSNSLAVSAINRASGRDPITERTVQSWLIESHRVSSRPCPEWAIIALREHVASLSPSDQEHLKGEAARRLERPAWLRVDETYAVDYATNDIERDARTEREWGEVAHPALAKKLAKSETYQLGFMHGQNRILSALAVSLRHSATFEQFKRAFVERDTETSFIESQTRAIRREIESGTGEFSAFYGKGSE